MIELWTHSLLVCRVGASDHDRNEAKSEDPPCSLGQDDRQLLADLAVRNVVLLGQDRGPFAAGRVAARKHLNPGSVVTVFASQR